MTIKEVIKRLKKEGWKLERQKGSHMQFKHPDKPGRVTVSAHSGDIPIGTLKSIYKQAGWE